MHFRLSRLSAIASCFLFAACSGSNYAPSSVPSATNSFAHSGAPRSKRTQTIVVNQFDSLALTGTFNAATIGTYNYQGYNDSYAVWYTFAGSTNSYRVYLPDVATTPTIIVPLPNGDAPGGIVTGSDGNIYMAIIGTNTILEVSPSAPKTANAITLPLGVSIDGGIANDNADQIWVNGSGNFGYYNFSNGQTGAPTTTLSCASSSLAWALFSNSNLLCPSTASNAIGHYNIAAKTSGLISLSNGGQTNANPVQVVSTSSYEYASDYQYGNGSPDISVDVIDTTPKVSATIPPIAAYSDSGAITANSGIYVLGKNLEYILPCLSGGVGQPPTYETAIIPLTGDLKTMPGGMVSTPMPGTMNGGVWVLSNVAGGGGLFSYTRPSLDCPEVQPTEFRTVLHKDKMNIITLKGSIIGVGR